MTIAEQKRQNNIVEYIIHMYQSEDLIRAFECDIEKVKEYVIKHIPQQQDKKEDLTQWYSELLDQMTKEKILVQGHLKSVQKDVNHLDLLKDKLLKKDKEFITIYDNAKPHIEEMLALAKGQVTSEIQICINGIYGLLIAKINGREVPEEFMPAIDQFGNVLSYLSYKFKQEEYTNNN